MNRRLVSIITAIVLSVAVAGCGSQSGSTGNSAKTTTEQKQQVETKTAAETKTQTSNTTDTSDLITQEYYFDGIDFKMPERWKFSADNSSSESQLFYTNDNNAVLVVSAENNQTGTDIEDIKDKLIQNIENGTSASSYTNLHDVNVAGYDGFMFDCSGTLSNTDVDLRIMVINNTKQSKSIGIMAIVPKGKNQDLLTDVDYLADHASVTDKENNLQGTAQNNSASSEETSSEEAADSTGVTPELKEFLDSYESFMDEYVEFMDKYKQNPSDLELLAQYSDYLTKLSEFEQKANEYADQEGEMSTADLNYYIEVTTRISKKLLQASVTGSTQ